MVKRMEMKKKCSECCSTLCVRSRGCRCQWECPDAAKQVTEAACRTERSWSWVRALEAAARVVAAKEQVVDLDTQRFARREWWSWILQAASLWCTNIGVLQSSITVPPCHPPAPLLRRQTNKSLSNVPYMMLSRRAVSTRPICTSRAGETSSGV